MNFDLSTLFQDLRLVQRLQGVASVAEAATALVEAATAHGMRLTRDAAATLLHDQPAPGRELAADQWLVVSGGMMARDPNFSKQTGGHTCCYTCSGLP